MRRPTSSSKTQQLVAIGDTLDHLDLIESWQEPIKPNLTPKRQTDAIPHFLLLKPRNRSKSTNSVPIDFNKVLIEFPTYKTNLDLGPIAKILQTWKPSSFRDFLTESKTLKPNNGFKLPRTRAYPLGYRTIRSSRSNTQTCKRENTPTNWIIDTIDYSKFMVQVSPDKLEQAHEAKQSNYLRVKRSIRPLLQKGTDRKQTVVTPLSIGYNLMPNNHQLSCTSRSSKGHNSVFNTISLKQETKNQSGMQKIKFREARVNKTKQLRKPIQL